MLGPRLGVAERDPLRLRDDPDHTHVRTGAAADVMSAVLSVVGLALMAKAVGLA